MRILRQEQCRDLTLRDARGVREKSPLPPPATSARQRSLLSATSKPDGAFVAEVPELRRTERSTPALASSTAKLLLRHPRRRRHPPVSVRHGKYVPDCPPRR